ncbi:tetratricopeptide repeat protein [Candidatus Sumerlaeota bacterium]|nr:tetratricopeptide repeat protein [Candidatus Sumerlaeota bacterium]
MSEQKMDTNEPETQAAAETPPLAGPGQGLHERQVERFVQTMESGVIAALDRFGFGAFHSLSTEEKLLRREEMGIPCGDAGDHYNLGLAHAGKGDYAKAIACWEQALKTEPGMTEALFNIALANERLGNLQGARTHYRRYIKEIDDPEEVQRIEDHLSAIGK